MGSNKDSNKSSKDNSKESSRGSDDGPPTGIFGNLKSAFSRGKKPVSQEDFLELVDDADELQEDEKRMIGEILSLDGLTAAEVMQPRVDIIAVEDLQTVRETLERMQGTGYSRLPIYHEDLDHIVGIVHYKDMVPAVLDGNDTALACEFISEALFVPETKDVLPLLSEMQTACKQMAIVIDEYGGTDGLITIEDIVEEIVGEITDETDLDAPDVQEVGAGEWLVDGRFPVEDALALDWPVHESDQYETIAGWLLDTIDRVPHVGDEFVFDGYLFKVLSMRRRRIKSLLVKWVSGADALHESETGADRAPEEVPCENGQSAGAQPMGAQPAGCAPASTQPASEELADGRPVNVSSDASVPAATLKE